MTKDFENEVPGDEGSDATASGPDSQEDELTVDDILDAPQTDEAAVAEASDEDKDLLLDLKRVQAEYANYRRRTEEQREVEVARAKGAVAKGLLPVLDDLDRAEQHGDLAEGTAFSTIAQKLRSTLERFGLVSFGEKGESFDPQVHEAIAQVPVPGTEQDTVLDVIERGYRLGDVELRPAKVAVAVGADG